MSNVEKRKRSCDWPYFVRQAGLEYGPERGAIKGFDDYGAAKDDCRDRNQRAIEMGLDARYEVITDIAHI